MKLNTKEFQEALKIVKPGLGRNENVEQSTSFAFKDERVITYNDEICISHPIDGLDVTGAVIGSTLYDYVTKLKRDEIELKATKKELRIQCGRSKAGIPMEVDIRMPLEELEAATDWMPVPDNFADFLLLSSGACARDMNLGYLTCVSVNERGTIVGADNLRIMWCKFKNPKKHKIPTFLLPSPSAKLAGNMTPARICVTDNWVHFENDLGTILSCRKYNDEYEDIEEFLDIEGQTFTFPKTVEDVLIRANIFSKEETVQDEEIVFKVGANRISIKAEGDHGWFEETINNAYEEEPFTFSIVPYLLRDILRRSHVCTVSEHGMLFAGEDWKYVSTLKSIE